MTAAHDHLADELGAAGSAHAQLAAHAHHAFRDPDCARCSSGEHAGRRATPQSRPAGDLVVVSHMDELERFVPRWNVAARWLLDPHLGARVDLTDRAATKYGERVVCPVLHGEVECGGRLVAWPNLLPQGVIRCMACLTEWRGRARANESEWRRLAVLTDAHADGRYGPRLPLVAG